jgi:signal recognition particle subunit SRP54
MFDNLSEKLQATFKKLRGHGKLTEKNIQEGLREVKLALLEADVNYKVVKQFIADVQQQAVGQEVLNSISPGQQVVKIVHQELVKLMGGSYRQPALASEPPTIIMLMGLQGAGKTTTTAKLARRFKQEGKSTMLVAADPYRPAAAKQLNILADQLGVDCYCGAADQSTLKICRQALKQAREKSTGVVIIDTAGRLQIDEQLMGELKELKQKISPHYIWLVADAMTGQEAVRVAQGFEQEVGIDGIILTKLEGDARGGAALSLRAVTGKPIQFVGMGEKLDALEPFHPERMVSRILGMGDVLSLVERAEAVYSQEKTRELEKKLRGNTFTLEDFSTQLKQLKKMGPLEQILGMIPGLGNTKMLKGLKLDDKEFVHTQAIIDSMTPEERRNYKIINGSRRRRIARGSGTSVQQVNKLLKQFIQMQKMMKRFPKSPAALRGGPGLPFKKMPFI